MVTDESISKANNEIEDKLKKVGLDEESNYILLLRIFPTSGGLEWKDYSGEEGQGVQDLFPSFYSSSIVTLMRYTYALSLKKKVPTLT
jgi:hypothetical protein